MISPESQGPRRNENRLLDTLPTHKIRELAEKSKSPSMLEKLREIIVGRAFFNEFDTEAEETALYIDQKLQAMKQSADDDVLLLGYEAMFEAERIKEESSIEDEIHRLESVINYPQDPQLADDEEARIALFQTDQGDNS